MRSAAKAVNFGIVYGISDFGLARNLGIPRKRAAEYIEAYLAKYTGVQNYMHSVVEQAKADGNRHAAAPHSKPCRRSSSIRSSRRKATRSKAAERTPSPATR